MVAGSDVLFDVVSELIGMGVAESRGTLSQISISSFGLSGEGILPPGTIIYSGSVVALGSGPSAVGCWGLAELPRRCHTPGVWPSVEGVGAGSVTWGSMS